MNYEKFEPLLGTWGETLRPFIESSECDKIYSKLKEDSLKGRIICPEAQDTWRVFKETPLKYTKVVFLLQDPYPWVKDGVFVADGIALSCRNTKVLQPSLVKFYEAIEESIEGIEYPELNRKADLSHLTVQGCMMLNTALTVEKDKPSSHSALWRPFTQYLLENVFGKMTGIIFVLSGKESEYFERFINPLQHHIFKIEHPAFAARQMRKWNYDDVFNKINKLLISNGKPEIIWTDDLPF